MDPATAYQLLAIGVGIGFVVGLTISWVVYRVSRKGTPQHDYYDCVWYDHNYDSFYKVRTYPKAGKNIEITLN